MPPGNGKQIGIQSSTDCGKICPFRFFHESWKNFNLLIIKSIEAFCITDRCFGKTFHTGHLVAQVAAQCSVELATILVVRLFPLNILTQLPIIANQLFIHFYCCLELATAITLYKFFDP